MVRISTFSFFDWFFFLEIDKIKKKYDLIAIKIIIFVDSS